MFFVVFKDRRKQHRWHLKAGNGRIIAKSAQPHDTEGKAIDAAIDAANDRMTSYANFDFYKDKKGEWRWRCVQFSNGKGADKILADSAESYTRKANAQRMVTKVANALAIASGAVDIRSE